jgi:hypothetical protein
VLNRRAFLQLLGAGTVAAVAFDPERLLWVPGAKTIFLPPEKSIVVASTMPAYHWFTDEAMALMSKELGFHVPPPDYRAFRKVHLTDIVRQA